MKILFVNTTPSSRNGITNVIFNLIKSIDKSDLEIGYVSISEITEECRILLEEFNVKSIILNRSIKNCLSYIKSLSKFAKGYDVIHVHGNSATITLELIAAKIAKIPLRCAHSHNTTCSMKVLDQVMRPLFNTLCNGRIACGSEAGKWLFGEKDFLLLKNGIDTSRFKYSVETRKKIRQQLNLENNYIIGNVANFVDAKNHIFMIDIFSFISKQIDNITLLLIGAGPLLEQAKTHTRKLGLENKIIFTGSISNVEEYLSAIDLIVMPSKFEGLPLTLIEEQANGLNAVVSDVITSEVNLTDNVIFLSLSCGPQVWAETIIRQFKNGMEREEEKSNHCISLITEAGYDIESSAKRLKEYYIDQLKKHGKQ